MNPLAYKPARWTTDAIHYKNIQWAVTDFGIENVAGPYHYFIPFREIGVSIDWLDHMAGKNWVDIEEFEDAYDYAVDLKRKIA